MKYLAAYFLLTLSGKPDPSVSDMTSFLKESLISSPDQTAIERVVSAYSGKSLKDLINRYKPQKE